MSEDARNEQISVRVIRNGAPEPPDKDWSMATPEERIEAVWTLTELCWPGTNLQQMYPDFKEMLLAFYADDVEYLKFYAVT